VSGKGKVQVPSFKGQKNEISNLGRPLKDKLKKRTPQHHRKGGFDYPSDNNYTACQNISEKLN
jgi:hypothetical protein